MKRHEEPESLVSLLSYYRVCLEEMTINLAEWFLFSHSQKLSLNQLNNREGSSFWNIVATLMWSAQLSVTWGKLFRKKITYINETVLRAYIPP